MFVDGWVIRDVGVEIGFIFLVDNTENGGIS